MTCFSKKILDYFYNVQNTGRIIKPEAIGRAGSNAEGTVIEFSWRVINDRIEDARFRTFGDVNAIAISSIVTTMTIGKSIDEVLTIKPEDVLEQLQDIKTNYLYLIDLALYALSNTYNNYQKNYAKQNSIQYERKNDYADEFRSRLSRIENGENVEDAYKNYDLSELSISEAEDEQNYLDNLNNYENSFETEEKSIDDIVSDISKEIVTRTKTIQDITEKRHRGRPRKVVDVTAEAEKVVSTEPKRRGRPRKIVNIETTIEHSVEIKRSTVESIKVVNNKENVSTETSNSSTFGKIDDRENTIINANNIENTNVAIEDINTNQEPTTEIRHRGRPRKYPIKIESTEPKRRGRPRKYPEIQETTTEKRGRGRPRKIVDETEVVINTEPKHRGRPRKVVDVTAEAEKVVSTEPKHRGRPRKILTEEEQELLKNKVKLGRGRPRKIVYSSDTFVVRSEFNNQINYEETQQQTQIEEPKHRGRPRKEVEVVETSVEPKHRGRPRKIVNETEVPQNAEPKHRGRPKKILTEEEQALLNNQVKRGRGRPKKEQNDELVDNSVINETPSRIKSINEYMQIASDIMDGKTNSYGAVYNDSNSEEPTNDNSNKEEITNNFAPAQNKYGVGQNPIKRSTNSSIDNKFAFNTNNEIKLASDVNKEDSSVSNKKKVDYMDELNVTTSLSDDVNKILSSGGSVSDALRALMEK